MPQKVISADEDAERIDVTELANGILDARPDAVVRLRLLRDVLGRPDHDAGLVSARDSLAVSPWGQLLAAEQHPDGGWGRFHTRNCSIPQKTPTTEAGVERAIALGLDAQHSVLATAAYYIARILRGEARFPDRAEKNDLWPTAVGLFSGSKLAEFAPNAPALDSVWDLWLAILSRTFGAGRHSAEAEQDAHDELTGASSVKGTYLALGTKYHLSLLGGRTDRIPPAVERAFVTWIWHRARGLGYLDVPLHCADRSLTKGKLERWFVSHEILSRFPTWRELAGDAMDWLWAQHNGNGLWDFGPRVPWSNVLPLSDTWRNRRDRVFDHSTRALALLQRYHGDRPPDDATGSGEGGEARAD